MLGTLFRTARPLLFGLEPERAHELTLKLLEAGFYPRTAAPSDSRLATDVWGLRFPNPLGVAAGFDKDARVYSAVLDMGLGFTEIGTVTPRPQPGNPRPRVFRITSHHALINRFGFNSGGHEAALGRLRRRPTIGVVGINVGANKDATDRNRDYVEGLRRFWDVATFFTVNISSPNTPGLRDLQAPAALDALLEQVLSAKAEMTTAGKPSRPIVVKLAPDIAEDDLPLVANVLLRRGVDGIALGNTTLSRAGVDGATHAQEAGGLSGPPLFHRSTVMLARIYRLTGGRVPLIGIGGIDSGAAAIAKIEAGATLLQLYTGLVFEGPDLIHRILRALADYSATKKLARIADATGSRAQEWAAKPLQP